MNKQESRPESNSFSETPQVMAATNGVAGPIQCPECGREVIATPRDAPGCATAQRPARLAPIAAPTPPSATPAGA